MHVNVPVFSGEGAHCERNRELCLFVPFIAAVKCMWPDTPANKRRRVFCSKYEGYKDLCHCSKPSAINEGVALVSRNLKIKHHFSLFLLAW